MTSSSTVGTDPLHEIIDRLSIALGRIEGRAEIALSRIEAGGEPIPDSLVVDLAEIRNIARAAGGRAS